MWRAVVSSQTETDRTVTRTVRPNFERGLFSSAASALCSLFPVPSIRSRFPESIHLTRLNRKYPVGQMVK